ncbi:MAG: AraC family transcriptional regulator, partial [Kordiimonadaceae bacterium]|nr:AraC family transcriptional regulator [Kordiimonadaceae bacterium]
ATLGEYMGELIQLAEEYREAEGSISDIAHKLGFYDQSAFTSHFRKQIGITPLAYLKQHSLRREKR